MRKKAIVEYASFKLDRKSSSSTSKASYVDIASNARPLPLLSMPGTFPSHHILSFNMYMISIGRKSGRRDTGLASFKVPFQ
jgi:hypothetical protein